MRVNTEIGFPIARFGTHIYVRAALDVTNTNDNVIDKLKDFVAGVLHDFNQSDRSYMTIAIGCTGGQHRSVYLTEKLHGDLIAQFPAAQIRHRDLQEAGG